MGRESSAPVEGAADAVRLRPKQHAVDGGDVEGSEVVTAERAVRGAGAGDRVSLQDFAGGRKDIHQGAGSADLPPATGDDVAFGIEAHAVDAAVFAEIVQDERGSEGFVVVHGVRPELALLGEFAAALGDVKL